MALDVTSCRSEKEKLEWAFRLYDVDDSGSINLKEITAIMETLDQVKTKIQFFHPLSQTTNSRIRGSIIIANFPHINPSSSYPLALAAFP